MIFAKMMNSLIWLLTDIDFAKEWGNSSIFERFQMCYISIGLLGCEILTLLLLAQGVIDIFSRLT